MYLDRPKLSDQVQYAIAVADVQVVMSVGRNRAANAFPIPAGVAIRPKENTPLIIVHAMDLIALRTEEKTDFGADQSCGPSGQNRLHRLESLAFYPWKLGNTAAAVKPNNVIGAQAPKMLRQAVLRQAGLGCASLRKEVALTFQLSIASDPGGRRFPATP